VGREEGRGRRERERERKRESGWIGQVAIYTRVANIVVKS